jgi:hypothetical protein
MQKHEIGVTHHRSVPFVVVASVAEVSVLNVSSRSNLLELWETISIQRPSPERSVDRIMKYEWVNWQKQDISIT